MADTTFNPYLYDPNSMSNNLGAAGGGFPQTTQPTSGSNWWTTQSPQTQAALIGTGTSLLGGYLSQRNQNQQNTQSQQAAAAQSAANNQSETQRLSMQLEQARILAQNQMGVQGQLAAPTRQDWRQKQAVLADVLPQLRNVQVTPPGDLGRYMPQMSGGLKLPEGGLSASALNFFSPQARLGAESDLDKQLSLSTGGNYNAPDYAKAGYGSAGQSANQGVTDYSSLIKQQLMQQQQQALQQAMGQSGAASPRTALTAGNSFLPGVAAR